MVIEVIININIKRGVMVFKVLINSVLRIFVLEVSLGEIKVKIVFSIMFMIICKIILLFIYMCNKFGFLGKDI